MTLNVSLVTNNYIFVSTDVLSGGADDDCDPRRSIYWFAKVITNGSLLDV